MSILAGVAIGSSSSSYCVVLVVRIDDEMVMSRSYRGRGRGRGRGRKEKMHVSEFILCRMGTHGETAFVWGFKAQYEEVPGCLPHLSRAQWVASCQHTGIFSFV